MQSFCCDCPTVSVIIRNLEKKGWLVKQPDLENKKHIRISITLDGAKKLNQVIEAGYKGDKTFDPETVLTVEGIDKIEKLHIKIQKGVQCIKAK